MSFRRPSEISSSILVIGYGNPGRRDDGLGPAFAAGIEVLGLAGVSVEVDYQLSIEHAELASRYEIVVFADAAKDIEGEDAFYLRPIMPSSYYRPFSHSISPGAVLHLAADCFHAHPQAWLLGIRPFDTDSFFEGLSTQAESNLRAVVDAFRAALESGALNSGSSSGIAAGEDTS